MGKVEKALTVAELGLLAFLVWFIITKAEEYGKKLGAIKLPEIKITLPKPAQEALDYAKKQDEIRFIESSLPERIVTQIKQYTEGYPEGYYEYWLKQARRWYNYEVKLLGREPTKEEALNALMRIYERPHEKMWRAVI